MKCRLTVHGFKDTAAGSLDRYSGTSTRWGQRAVVATAVQNQWPMASLDVSEAFLKGFTCEEIKERRGGPKRRVSLMLPHGKSGEPSGVAILRTIKGYETFDEVEEVLEMLKGGFGLIDAPNLCTSRVDEIFVAEQLKPTCAEPKIYIKMDNAKLNLMVSAHMDDFKGTGPQQSLNWLREILSKAFGGDVKNGTREGVHSHWYQTHPCR